MRNLTCKEDETPIPYSIHLRSKMNTGPENVKSKFLLGDGKSKSLSSS